MARQRRWLGRRRPLNTAAFFELFRPVVTAEQCRAARAMLNWRREDLARETGLGERTIQEFENAERKTRNPARRLITDAFQRNGIEFIWPDGGKGAGLRLAAAPDAKPGAALSTTRVLDE